MGSGFFEYVIFEGPLYFVVFEIMLRIFVSTLAGIVFLFVETLHTDVFLAVSLV